MKSSIFVIIKIAFSILVLNSCNAENTQTISEKYKIGLSDSYVFKKTEQHKNDSIFAYGAEIRLPQLVTDNVNAKALNLTIKKDFETVIRKIQINPLSDQESFIKIDYNYYVEDTIVTLVVYEQQAWHLSEGTCRYEVYHYDFKNDKRLYTTDILASWGMSQVPLLNAIVENITVAGNEMEPDFDSLWFESVKWENINNLKLYRNKQLQLTVIYKIKENGIESEAVIE